MKVSALVALVAALLLVVLMATGLGGKHGPGRHMRSGGTGGHTAPAAGEHRP